MKKTKKIFGCSKEKYLFCNQILNRIAAKIRKKTKLQTNSKKIFDMTLQTEYQKKRAKKRADIYAEYRRLVANPANSRSAIIEHLKTKYNIGAASTIYGIIKEKEVENENN